MSSVHRAVAFAIVGGFLLLMLWGIVAWFAKRGPGAWYWRLLAVLQGALLVQLVGGGVLLLLGHRPPLLHYAYGAIFPALVLGVGHNLGRSMDSESDAVKVFTIAAFLVFGLTLRALMTGLGFR
ncbi:MAG: hypothetical protein ACRDJ4_00330 [Actinomycetota bacterium]